MKNVLGIDIGGTSTKIGIISDDGNIIQNWTIPTDKDNDEIQTLDSIITSFTYKNIHNYDICGVGIGIPGSVNPNNHQVYDCNNLGWNNNVNLNSYIESKLQVPVKIENDANVAALGEKWLGSIDAANILYVTLGTGVGAGIILNNKLITGSLGAAGELGHIVIDPDGFKCSCGNKGCLETVASATGIVHLYKSNSHDQSSTLTAKDIFKQAKSDDKIAIETIAIAIDYLALGIANTVNLLNLDEVILGGGVSAAGEFLRSRVQKSMDKYLYLNNKNHVRVKLAKLGNDAGILGAAYSVLMS